MTARNLAVTELESKLQLENEAHAIEVKSLNEMLESERIQKDVLKRS